MISTGIPLKENKSLTKECLSHSAASLGQPKSISQIISSTSKRFSLKGDCFTPFIKSPLFTPKGLSSLVIFHRVYFVTFMEHLFLNRTYNIGYSIDPCPKKEFTSNKKGAQHSFWIAEYYIACIYSQPGCFFYLFILTPD